MKKDKMQSEKRKERREKFEKGEGFLIVGSLVFGAIAILIISALTLWFGAILKSSKNAFDNERAFQIAEAGIDYYRWHLAHDDDDFKDGKTTDGPYVHDFLDYAGNKIGEFSLNIVPPQNGNTVVTIESTGTVINNPDVSRTIKVQMAKPSFAKYAFVSHSEMRFGEGTEVFGAIHSNGGIRFDGFANNIVSSALNQYDDPDHSGVLEFGVHTHISPIDPPPPNPVPVREDVFGAGRQFPVPAVNFDGIISNISNMKTLAQTSEGFYKGPSGKSGYEIVLKENNKFELYRVNSLKSPPYGCSNSNLQDGWGSWTISQREIMGTYDYPSNGIMFFEDNIWVRGKIDKNRLTIVAATFPDQQATRKSITVNDDILYTNYDGKDVIALIAQKNINVGMDSKDILRIDSALIAQNGRVGRYYYRPPSWFSNYCSPYHNKDTITVNGMIGSRLRYGFAYTDNTGYKFRNIVYDGNLLFGPPPQFPLTTEHYETISFDEVKK